VRRRVALVAVVLAAVTGGDAIAQDAPEDTSFYVFRTRDTGAPPTAEQDGRCDAHFGPRRTTTVTRLNARLFGFRSDAASGRIVDQTASLLGPGFICAAPQPSAIDPLEAYAYTELAGPGIVELTGPCQLPPVVARPGAAVLNCHLQARANAATGLRGGLVTSNSLVNLVESGAGAPTGSVWTAQLLGDLPALAGATAQPVPTGVEPETPGLDFFVARTIGAMAASGSSQCAVADAGVRAAGLTAAQPDLVTGRVPDASGPRAGALTVCYSAMGPERYRATAVATLRAAAGDFTVTAAGECRDEATAAARHLRAQSCALSIDNSESTGVQGGLITSNGLVPADIPAGEATPSLWTFSLFGAPPGTPPSVHAPVAPSLTLNVAGRTRRATVRARWRPAGLTAPVRYRVTLVRRSGGHAHWTLAARATRRRSLTLRLPRPGLYELRVSATGADGERTSPAIARVRRLRARPRA